MFLFACVVLILQHDIARGYTGLPALLDRAKYLNVSSLRMCITEDEAHYKGLPYSNSRAVGAKACSSRYLSDMSSS